MSQPQTSKEETKMKLYGAIDLHSTNNVTVLIDEEDKIVYEKRLPNDLALILRELSVYQSRGHYTDRLYLLHEKNRFGQQADKT
jgi:hypothetical protein